MLVKDFIGWIELSKASHGAYVDYDNAEMLLRGSVELITCSQVKGEVHLHTMDLGFKAGRQSVIDEIDKMWDKYKGNRVLLAEAIIKRFQL